MDAGVVRQVEWDMQEIVGYIHGCTCLHPNDRRAMLLGSDDVLSAMGLETMAEEALRS